jgi:hypothetical protein
MSLLKRWKDRDNDCFTTESYGTLHWLASKGIIRIRMKHLRSIHGLNRFGDWIGANLDEIEFYNGSLGTREQMTGMNFGLW